MNRRQFMLAATSAGLLALAGCAGEKPGEKFLGYWQGESAKHPRMFKITRNGENLLFIESRWMGGSYETRTEAAVLKQPDNVLVVAQVLNVAYEHASGHLIMGSAKARRITQAEYLAVIKKS